MRRLGVTLSDFHRDNPTMARNEPFGESTSQVLLAPYADYYPRIKQQPSGVSDDFFLALQSRNTKIWRYRRSFSKRLNLDESSYAFCKLCRGFMNRDSAASCLYTGG